MTAGPPLDAGIDAAILDRMTDTLIILQAKSATADRSKMIAALQALRGRHPDALVILVEGESDAHVIRECLQFIEQTSLGTPGARRTRAKATAERVAGILLRHQELPEITDGTVRTRADGPPPVPVLHAARGEDSLPRVRAASASADVALLVRRAAEGDMRAWERLVDQYARLIWSITVDFKLAESDAADVAQTTWLRLLEHIHHIEYPDRVGSWLAATARNECLRSLAARKEAVLTDVEAEVISEMAAATLEVTDRILADERDQVVRDALSRLPRRWQRLLELLMADPPTPYADISDELGLPVGSIGPTRSRCLSRLREQLLASDADAHVASHTPGNSRSSRDWTTAGDLVRGLG